jgi:hypothetical protein
LPASRDAVDEARLATGGPVKVTQATSSVRPTEATLPEVFEDLRSILLCADQMRCLWAITDLKATYCLLQYPIGLRHALVLS